MIIGTILTCVVGRFSGNTYHATPTSAARRKVTPPILSTSPLSMHFMTKQKNMLQE
jgi:hypothetical protein